MIALVGNPADAQDVEARRCQEHDLGVILADGQVLRREFTLKNPTGVPIHLVRATALTPCCSAIGPLPPEIPPRAEVNVPVILKPGYQSGLKGVRFAVETDDKDQPLRTLALRVRLLSAWEVEPLAGSLKSLPLGHGGKRGFRLTARRKGMHGRSLPDGVSAASALSIAYDGEASRKTGEDGLIEASRDVVVTVAPSKQPGIEHSEIVFCWGGVQKEAYSLTWEVRPGLTASPSGLVVRSSGEPIEQRVVITSDGPPFRVERVIGPPLLARVDLPGGAATMQNLVLRLDTSRAPSERAVDLTVETDHPFQTAVSVSVLVVPEPKGARP